MLKQRIITAAILAAIFFAALFGLSTRWFGVFCLILLGGSAHEWAKLVNLDKRYAALFAGILVAAGAAALFLPAIDIANALPSPLAIVICALATAFWVLIAPAWIRNGWPTDQRPAMIALGALLLVAM